MTEQKNNPETEIKRTDGGDENCGGGGGDSGENCGGGDRNGGVVNDGDGVSKNRASSDSPAAEQPPAVVAFDDNVKKPVFRGPKERLYDKIPLTVKQLDVIIAILAVAFVVFFVIGVYLGNRQ